MSVSVSAFHDDCSHEDYARACEIIFKTNKNHNINDRLDEIPYDIGDAHDTEAYFERLVSCAEKRICNAEEHRNGEIDEAHRNVIHRILGRIGGYVNLINLQLPPLRNAERIKRRLDVLRNRAKNLRPETTENTPKKYGLFESPNRSNVPSPLQSPARTPMRNIGKTLRKMRV